MSILQSIVFYQMENGHCRHLEHSSLKPGMFAYLGEEKALMEEVAVLIRRFQTRMKQERREYDVDIVILYDENTDVRMVAQAVSEAAASGKTASAQKQIPEKLRYREIADLRKGTPIC